MFKACIMGASLTTGNMGVSALAASVVKLILTVQPDASITFFISERSSQPQELEVAGKKIKINVANTRLSPKAAFGEHLFGIFFLALLYKLIPHGALRKTILRHNQRLNTIAQADFTGDVRGGDSFSDIYGVKRFLMGSIPSLITLLMGKKLVLLPQTYGPYKSRISRGIAGYIFKRAHSILSRDHESIDLVRNILSNHSVSKQIIFCPDVAFALDSVFPKDGFTNPFVDAANDQPLIGLNINGLLYNGGYTRDNMFNLKLDYKLFVHQLSETILKTTRANLLLIPHTFAARGHVESDPDACFEVQNTLSHVYPGRIHMIEGEYDQHTVKGVIGKCNFFIGSRMHSCIAALSQIIPTVGVAYSKKFKGVFDSVGAGGFVIDAREVDTQEAIGRIAKMFEDRTIIEILLQVQIDAAQKLQLEIFRKLLTP